jgi:hypothetical protein
MVSTGKLRPSFPSETSSRTLAILVEKCSEFDAELRPSFAWICDYLKKNRTASMKTIPTTSTNWLSSSPTDENYQNRVKVEQKQEQPQQQQNEYSNVVQEVPQNEYSNVHHEQPSASRTNSKQPLNE